jgi:hypothetical protein
MDKLHGVVRGVFYRCNNSTVDEINDRMANRNIPSQSLQPQYSIRPVSTKYGYMQVLDQYKQSNVPLNNYNRYSTENVFNPGNAQAPWNGYSDNVNIESTLRNQFFALQKCEQSEYVPSSNSDLYETKISYTPQKQTHDLLFEKPEFSSFNPNENNLGGNLFNNFTRYQVKDIEN